MTPRLLHVGLTFPLPDMPISAVDQAIQSVTVDWLRYSYCCYLVWTTTDPEAIVRKITAVPGILNGAVFVCEVGRFFGFLPEWAWTWISKDRGWGPVQLEPPQPPPVLPTGTTRLTTLLGKRPQKRPT